MRSSTYILIDVDTEERVQEDVCLSMVVMLNTTESDGGELEELLDWVKAGRCNDLEEPVPACERWARSEAADGRYDRGRI